MTTIFEEPVFTWFILPLLIFLARTFDMTLSTLRIVFIAQGRHRLAPLVGFFESLLWLLVVGQALQHLSNPLCVVAYAGGFAFGNLVGLKVEQRLALGLRILRIILHQNADELVTALRERGLRVTEVDGEGSQGPVKILFTLLPRRSLESAITLVQDHNPTAFFSVEDVRQATEGMLPRPLTARRGKWRRLLAAS